MPTPYLHAKDFNHGSILSIKDSLIEEELKEEEHQAEIEREMERSLELNRNEPEMSLTEKE